MKTLEEIKKIREVKRKELDLRVNLKADTTEKHILVCRGTGCTSSKSSVIIDNLEKAVKENNLKNVKVIRNRLFWSLCKRTNCNYKTRGYFLCIGNSR